MGYVISVTISSDEHDEDRDEMLRQLLEGDRLAINPDTGEEISAEEFADLPRESQEQYAEEELGELWDSLWVYAEPMTEGLDRGSARVFATREEAQAHIDKYGSKDSTYEIWEA